MPRLCKEVLDNAGVDGRFESVGKLSDKIDEMLSAVGGCTDSEKY